jgi:LuxR family maltose regulon positive regulatory protein
VQEEHPISLASLRAPRLPHGHVPRSDLMPQLERGLGWPLLAIVAPAGSGKTTLAAEWYHSLRERGLPGGEQPLVSWLSLEGAGGSAESLWRHVEAALAVICPEGAHLEPGGHAGVSRGSCSTQACGDGSAGYADAPVDSRRLQALSNSLMIAEGETEAVRGVLFVDATDIVPASLAAQLLGFLANSMPASLKAVVTCTYLPRSAELLKARDSLFVFPAKDLGFSAKHVASLLDGMGGGRQGDAESGGLAEAGALAMALHERFDGWVGGLKLALSEGGIQGAAHLGENPGASQALGAFFTQRVLCHADARLEEFLIETSMLESLNAPLADAVTQSTGSQAVIDTLCEMNLFLRPSATAAACAAGRSAIDWHEYHPVFLAWLRSRLLSVHPDILRGINYRASRWYEAHGMPDESARHLLMAADNNLVEELSAQAGFGAHSGGASILEQVVDIPASNIRGSALLSLYTTWAYLLSGRPDDCMRWLEVFKQASLPSGHPAEAATRLVVECISVKCQQLKGAFAQTIASINDLLVQHGSAMGPSLRSMLLHSLAEDYEHLGQLEKAREHYLQAEAMASMAGSPFYVAFCRYELAALELSYGRFGNATEICYRSLKDCPLDYAQYGGFYNILAQTQMAKGQTKRAEESLRRAFNHLSPSINIDYYLEAEATMAALQTLTGKADDGYERIIQTTMLAERHPPLRGVLFKVYVAHARLSLLRGNCDDANKILYKLEACHVAQDTVNRLETDIIKAAVMLKCGSADEAQERLSQCLEQCTALSVIGPTLEARLLMAEGFDRLSKHAEALRCFSQALSLAAGYGYVSPFMFHRDTSLALLGELLGARKTSHTLRSFAKEVARLVGSCAQPGQPHDSALLPGLASLKLSERELEVLDLLQMGLTRQEISQSLHLSLNTVKTHIKNIFVKLGVNNKGDAVKALEVERL